MKNFQKYILISVLLSSVLFLGCTNIGQSNYSDENKMEVVSDNSLENVAANHDDIFVEYCAKEITAERRIYFNYPLFEEKIDNAAEINEEILKFVAVSLEQLGDGFGGNLKDSPESWEWDESGYTLQAMDIKYKIMRNDTEYFSVVFEGLYNYKTAAHPINYFSSLVIDVKKGELVTLSNLYTINADFAKMIRKKFKEQIRPGLAEKTGVLPEDISDFVEEGLSSYDDILLLESLCQTDPFSGFQCFLTNSALGVSVPLSHAIGDHFEIMIRYDELPLGYHS